MTRARNLSWTKSDRALDYLPSTTKGVLDRLVGRAIVVQTREVPAAEPNFPEGMQRNKYDNSL